MTCASRFSAPLPKPVTSHVRVYPDGAQHRNAAKGRKGCYPSSRQRHPEENLSAQCHIDKKVRYSEESSGYDPCSHAQNPRGWGASRAASRFRRASCSPLQPPGRKKHVWARTRSSRLTIMVPGSALIQSPRRALATQRAPARYLRTRAKEVPCVLFSDDIGKSPVLRLGRPSGGISRACRNRPWHKTI